MIASTASLVFLSGMQSQSSKNAALLVLLDVDGVFVESAVYLYSLWLDAVQARVFLEVAEEIDLPILTLLFILLNILTCES